MKQPFAEYCAATGEFEPIDLAFADFMLRFAHAPECEELYLAALFASRAVRLSHSCCPLRELAGTLFPEIPAEGQRQFRLPGCDAWLERLSAPALAAAVSRYPACRDAGFPTPLVIDDAGRLYLQRYLVYELQVAQAVMLRARRPEHPPELLPGAFDELFINYRSGAATGRPDFQRLAALAAASRDFTVISGGPGTGKTTVVAALLALEFARAPELRVALCAPTGKAQARLGEALREDGLKIGTAEAIRRRILELAPSTIDRLIGSAPLTHRTKYHAGNPLPFDLVIVDESSMVSLPLMARLMRALAPETRLILLGDPNQLASVESGAVLADICDSGKCNAFSGAIREAYLRQSPGVFLAEPDDARPLTGALAELTHNFRFDTAPAIGEVSSAIKLLQDGATPEKIKELTDFIHHQQNDDFRTIAVTRDQLSARLRQELARELPGKRGCFLRLAELAEAGTAEALTEAFGLLNAFKVLAAVRRGPFGVEELNRIIRELFHWKSDDTPGMPVMILANDRLTGLSNGDIGLFWKDLAGSGAPRIYFPGFERSFLAAELPEHEPVFAMTIHKSQGSGFSRALLVLPDGDSPVLTRELLYTGITRASKEVVLWSTPAVTRLMLERRTRRASGLQARLAEAQELHSGRRFSVTTILKS